MKTLALLLPRIWYLQCKKHIFLEKRIKGNNLPLFSVIQLLQIVHHTHQLLICNRQHIIRIECLVNMIEKKNKKNNRKRKRIR